MKWQTCLHCIHISFNNFTFSNERLSPALIWKTVCHTDITFINLFNHVYDCLNKLMTVGHFHHDMSISIDWLPFAPTLSRASLSKYSAAGCPIIIISSTMVLKLEQLLHCTPKKCQRRLFSCTSQSLHVILTTLVNSGGMGCKAIPMVIAFHVSAILSGVSAVFLQTGQRESKLASCWKQCQCMAWPQGISCEASREEKRSSWHTGQFDMYFPTLQLWSSKMWMSIHIPQAWQCRKFSSPPTRQNPQSLQWYGFSSFDIQRLHILQW